MIECCILATVLLQVNYIDNGELYQVRMWDTCPGWVRYWNDIDDCGGWYDSRQDTVNVVDYRTGNEWEDDDYIANMNWIGCSHESGHKDGYDHDVMGSHYKLPDKFMRGFCLDFARRWANA